MAKKPNFGPNFGLFGPNLGLKTFFWGGGGGVTLLAVRHCSKLSSYPMLRKTNESNLRKWQKNHVGPNFGILWPE